MTFTFLTRWKTIDVGLDDLQSPLYISGCQLQENLKDLTTRNSDQPELQWIHTFARLDNISNHFLSPWEGVFSFLLNSSQIDLLLFYLNFVANTLNLVNTNPSSLAVKANLKRTKHYSTDTLNSKKTPKVVKLQIHSNENSHVAP